MKKLTLLIILLFFSCENQSVIKRPNVILIMTDDQGYGDLGANNNQNIITPNLDDFTEKSIRFNNFFVSPVCAPTRSSLMTGRYSLRTGVRDTYNGGAMMSSDETTIAEILKEANYSTGIFGKWHLGDNYPFRPSDQGFDVSKISKGEFNLPFYNVCMEVENVGSSSGLILRECDKNPKQQFVFEDDGKIKPVNDLGLCLTASGSYSWYGGGYTPIYIVRDLYMTACNPTISERQSWGIRTVN